LKKGEIGGFALIRLAEIPPAPLYKRGKSYLVSKRKGADALFQGGLEQILENEE
jgi:hypothetical protein